MIAARLRGKDKKEGGCVGGNVAAAGMIHTQLEGR
jgi:hypothetical protein